MRTELLIPVTAALYYIPAIVFLIRNKHSWADIVVVGIITMIIAVVINFFASPWGTIAYVVVHIVFVAMSGYGLWELKRKK